MDQVKSALETLSTLASWLKVLQEDPNLRDNLLMLPILLPKSRKLIERSECWLFKSEIIDQLFPQLKDAEYDAQSILNELTYRKREVEASNRGTAGEFLSSSATNVMNWVSGYTRKVTEVHDRLSKLCDELKQDCDAHNIPANPKQFSKEARPETTSFIAEPKVFGRIEELNKVLSLMGVLSETNNIGSRAMIEKGVDLPESSSAEEKENIFILPIVGIGGVGKTTLAQMVCRAEQVQSHFNPIIWICVSDNFDVARLSKEIIECATKKTCDSSNLNQLQVTLLETLKCKRFLVLDDVWSESDSDWNRLLGPLKEGCEGSMVIVTTRSQKIAEITETVAMSRIILAGLESDVYWELFKSYAFGRGFKSENYLKLEEIGKQIVVKLKGSPLAAKTIGGILRTNLNEQHWNNVRNSEIWKLPQEEHGILPILQLSYQYLPSDLKKLFSFCSLFPKDHNFTEIELIHPWISQGFVDPQQKREIEVVTESYFDELVSRCLFQLVPMGGTCNPRCYVMHDVAQTITKNECYRIENEDFEKNISKDIRHLSVFEKRLSLDNFRKIGKYKKLHTLIIWSMDSVDRPYIFDATNSWCSKLKYICSLSLAHSGITNLPDNVGNLKHLKYLDISYSRVEHLPNSFCKLYKLEFFNMEGCRNFKRFPENSNRLISMKLLILPVSPPRFVEADISLVHHIPNLANAIQLDRLLIEGNSVGILKFINGIYEELGISRLDLVSDKGEAEQAQLNAKEFLNTLYLYWGERTEGTNDELHAEVLEGLFPNPNLKELGLIGYRGNKLPTWLEPDILTNIKTIYIGRCSNITDISCLPCSITSLRIRECPRLTSISDHVTSNLKSLEYLSIENCTELRSVGGPKFLESVKETKITGCPKLGETKGCKEYQDDDNEGCRFDLEPLKYARINDGACE